MPARLFADGPRASTQPLRHRRQVAELSATRIDVIANSSQLRPNDERVRKCLISSTMRLAIFSFATVAAGRSGRLGVLGMCTVIRESPPTALARDRQGFGGQSRRPAALYSGSCRSVVGRIFRLMPERRGPPDLGAKIPRKSQHAWPLWGIWRCRRRERVATQQRFTPAASARTGSEPKALQPGATF
jgi:hypothetical protein